MCELGTWWSTSGRSVIPHSWDIGVQSVVYVMTGQKNQRGIGTIRRTSRGEMIYQKVNVKKVLQSFPHRLREPLGEVWAVFASMSLQLRAALRCGVSRYPKTDKFATSESRGKGELEAGLLAGTLRLEGVFRGAPRLGGREDEESGDDVAYVSLAICSGES